MLLSNATEAQVSVYRILSFNYEENNCFIV